MFSKAPLFILLVIGLLLVSCQNDPGPTQPYDSANFRYSALSKIILPADAELQTAKLFVYVHAYGSEEPGMVVDVKTHRITAPWTELGVTWGNFAAAYDLYVFGSFIVNGTGWLWVDVTDLVQGWLDGDYPNYGILLDQDLMCWAHFYSRENPGHGTKPEAAPPYLEITYSTPSGTATETVDATADAYIWEQNATSNYGDRLFLKSGYDERKEKQVLLFCEVEQEEEPGDGCTRTPEFWRNHCGVGCEPEPDLVTQYLPIWLGDEGGVSSILVGDAWTAYQILWMFWGDPDNGIIVLYAQLLAAKLNIAAGADGSSVAAEISSADEFLAEFDYTDWDFLSPYSKELVLNLAAVLADFNSGIIGPGPCVDDI
ncbi:MAG: DNRLRE domain-containing protein [Candidatus Zixiibacteriota bacterium]|nr:MAG: DNRLRE domain-containing protein [candidate division Zixibacteria bacterium]